MPSARPRIRKLATSDPGDWGQIAGKQLFLRSAVNDAHEGLLTVGFGRLGKGEEFDFTFPYDEVMVVTRGGIAWHVEEEIITQRVGDLAYYPSGAAANGKVEEDTEAVFIIHPPYWQFTESDWQRLTAPESAERSDRTQASDSAPARMRVFRAEDQTLEQVGELQFASTTVLDDPGAEMTAKFERVGKGVAGDHFFPYEEVHVVTKGALTIRTAEETITARPGEALYLPMRSRGLAQADEDVEMVSVTFPPNWQIRSASA